MQSPATESTPNDQYKGVGGWLMLLCVGLTILGPLRSLGTLIQSYKEFSPHFGRFPVLRVLMDLDIPLSILLAAFSIYAGNRLWQVKPGAVKTAKTFFLFMLAYTAITSVLPFSTGLPPQFASAMIPEVMKGIFQNIIVAAIWISYLNKSKRVKATYPDAA
jgi:hypothetical protein